MTEQVSGRYAKGELGKPNPHWVSIHLRIMHSLAKEKEDHPYCLVTVKKHLSVSLSLVLASGFG